LRKSVRAWQYYKIEALRMADSIQIPASIPDPGVRGPEWEEVKL
jgi:hypothetical protein